MTVDPQPIRSVAVIGAGSWGTALAEVAARAGRDVMLYARDAGLADKINASRENDRYLPGATLHPRLRATPDMGEAIAAAELVIAVTPAQHMREAMTRMRDYLLPGVPVLSSAKGIEIETGALMSEIAADVLPDNPYGTLSGPTFAVETVRGLPTAITLATKADPATAHRWAAALHTPFFRPYLSDDPVGAEIAGALKNTVAIACGIVEGLALGQNARAAVMTRGMAEIKRYGMARGASADTFLGLSGLGDLTLTCHSMTSRNFSLGVELGRGRTLADIMRDRRTVAEGAPTARAMAAIAAKTGIDMPIAIAVDRILHEGAAPLDVVREMLSRQIKVENI